MKKIFVVSHKSYEIPNNSDFCLIKVGQNEFEHSVSDSTQNNIAHLNDSFCELTALYWIWKNTNYDQVGLVHYRRYFKPKNHAILLKGKKIAAGNDFDSINDEKTDIIVAKPRNYLFISIKDHYKKAHHSADFDIMRKEIELQFPEYIPAFERVVSDSKMSLCNMFVGKKSVIDEYCNWLFSILFALEKKIDYQSYDPHQKRVFGFMAERLFNVWLLHNKDRFKIEYRPIINIEGENIFKKGINLLKRQYF